MVAGDGISSSSLILEQIWYGYVVYWESVKSELMLNRSLIEKKYDRHTYTNRSELWVNKEYSLYWEMIVNTAGTNRRGKREAYDSKENRRQQHEQDQMVR